MIALRSKHAPRRFVRNEVGAVAVEFALIVPFFLLLMLGGFEVSRYVLINQRAERSSYAVADIVAQQTSPTKAQLDQIILAATEIMKPYEMGTKSRVIISSVYKTGTAAPKVQWQQAGGGTLTAVSKVGAVNQNAVLPGGLTLVDKDNVIIAEFFYKVEPVLPGFGFSTTQIYKAALFKPRLGALNSPPA